MEERAKFRNTSGGSVGYVKIDARGERKGMLARPGEEIWLTQQEIIETAEAPRNPEDSPFEPGRTAVIDEETGQQLRNADDEPVWEAAPPQLLMVEEMREVPTTRTLPNTPRLESEETADVPPTSPEPPAPAEGTRPADEEVGDPASEENATTGGRTLKGAKGGDVFVPAGVELGVTPGWPVDENGAPLELTAKVRKDLAKKELAKA